MSKVVNSLDTYTIDKVPEEIYQCCTWLEEKYRSVENLNKECGTSYVSFKQFAIENIIGKDLSSDNEENTHEEDKVEEDKIEEDKVEEDKVEEDKVEEDKVEEDKVEEDKVEEDKVEEDNVEEDKVEEDNVEEDKVEEREDMNVPAWDAMQVPASKVNTEYQETADVNVDTDVDTDVDVDVDVDVDIDVDIEEKSDTLLEAQAKKLEDELHESEDEDNESEREDECFAIAINGYPYFYLRDIRKARVKMKEIAQMLRDSYTNYNTNLYYANENAINVVGSYRFWFITHDRILEQLEIKIIPRWSKTSQGEIGRNILRSIL